MKLKITLYVLAVFTALIVLNFSDLNAKSAGSPGGKSSSMGDSGSSCGQGGCHGGGHTTLAGMITTDIPSSGYVPGDSYTINVNGNQGSGSKFGYEMAAENSSNASVGTFSSSTGRSQILTSKHATHTASGNAGTSGNFGWTLSWIAPASGTGTVTFSAAVIAANNNGANTGDICKVFNTSFNEATTTNLEENELTSSLLFPNPVVNVLNIQTESSEFVSLKLYSVNGKLMVNKTIFPKDKIDLSFLTKGIYFVQLENENGRFTKKIQKM